MNPNFRKEINIKNKSEIITGSTSGIGLSLTQHLAGEGCHIMLNGFDDRHEIENLQQELSAHNRITVLYSDADMTNPEQIEAMVQ
jgi:3-hydroxybutyrate dehydrogenase